MDFPAFFDYIGMRGRHRRGLQGTRSFMAYYCFKCGKEVEFAVKGGIMVGRLDACEHCGAYLHCCKNCEFYDPGLHNQCRDPNTEFIRDREEPNFCNSFEYRNDDAPPARPDIDSAKSKLENLFKNLK